MMKNERTANNRIFLRGALWLACILGLWLMALSVVAEEKMLVKIPVLATGADCKAVLVDQRGGVVASANLQKDVEGALEISCTGLFRFTYTVRLDMQDTAHVKYDKSRYTVYIDLVYDADGELDALLTFQNEQTGSKPARLQFSNGVIPVKPTATPKPSEYTQSFTFTKIWKGSHEDSIDWAFYAADGSQMSKKFSKKIISSTQWRYSAWFRDSDNIDGCYIIETPMRGYTVQYENVGKYAGVTDRCYNGGRIINHAIPKTGDEAAPGLWLAIAEAAVTGIGAMALAVKRKKARHSP